MPLMARPSSSLRSLFLLAILSACSHTTVLLVVDQDAGAGHRGAIFKLDPETRKVRLFARSELFFKPQDILQEPDGSFLFPDKYLVL